MNNKQELLKCANDFVYFCEKYVKIVNPKEGLVLFKLHAFQKRYIGFITKYNYVIGKKFRQGGFTTLSAIYFLWRLIFKLDEHNVFLTKTDREAIAANKIARVALENLPESLKPNLSKSNSHQLVCDENNSSLHFITPTPACGRKIDYLYIEDATFMENMDSNWKAMYPCLSMGGRCIVMSTTNRKKGWFYKTYIGAEKKENQFKVYTCEYKEHPDYQNEKRVAEMQQNLGWRGFRQEFLCEFIDDETVDDRIHKAEDFLDEINFNKLEIYHRQPTKLSFEDQDLEVPIHTWKERWDNYRLNTETKPTVVQFKTLTKEQIKEQFKEYHKDWKPEDTVHPEFPEDTFKTVESLFEHYEICHDETWNKLYRKQKKFYKMLEHNANNYCNDTEAYLAGLIPKSAITDSGARVDLNVLHIIQDSGEFPEEMTLDWFEGSLTVNEVPTTIKEEEVSDLYNGLAALVSEKEATDKVVGIIRDKLKCLFWKE